MNETSKTVTYDEFIKAKGFSLAEINPGSEEFALSKEDAIIAINLIQEEHRPILGGDILTKNETGNMAYAFQDWGSKYFTLNWSCDRTNAESYEDYCNRSYFEAIRAINIAQEASNEIAKPFFVVVVPGD